MTEQHQERTNATTFNDPAVIERYPTGFSDMGERRALRYLRDRLGQCSVLDVGVGSGRTVAFLQKAFGPDYIGVDIAPRSIDRARSAHPGVDLRVADARDLSSIADRSKRLVVFSYNGIDAVGDEDRQAILRELSRIVCEDGVLWFSTLNLESPDARAKPWQLTADGGLTTDRWWSLRVLGRLGPSRAWRTYRNWLRLIRHSQVGDGWEIRPLLAHDFALMAHFETLSALRAETEAAQLTIERIFATTGDVIEDGTTHTAVPYVHVIATRAAGHAAGA